MGKKLLIKLKVLKSVFLKAAFPALIFWTFLKTTSPSLIDLNPTTITSSPVLSFIIAIISFTLGYLGYNKIKPEFAKSNLQKHKTYLDFALCILSFLFLIFAIDNWIEKTPQTNSSLIFAIIFLIILIFGIILKCSTKPLFVTTLKRRFYSGWPRAATTPMSAAFHPARCRPMPPPSSRKASIWTTSSWWIAAVSARRS